MQLKFIDIKRIKNIIKFRRAGMNFKGIADIVGKGAPLVGSLLLGNAGGKVGSMIASALGVENDHSKIMEKLKIDPDSLLKIKQIETTHKEELQRLQFEEMKVITTDISNARSRELEMAKMGKTEWHMPALSWFVSAGYIGLVFTLIFVPIPQDTSGAIMMLFGSLSTAWGVIISYYYGSSHGHAKKDEVIANSSLIDLGALNKDVG